MIITGLCRFSLVGRGDWQAYRFKEKSEFEAIALEKAKELFQPERIEARLHSFEHLTLASLQAQTDQDFIFIVMASNLMPKRYRKQLEELCAKVPQVRLQFFDITPTQVAQKQAYKKLGITLGDTLQFRIDDDDCVCVDFIEKMRAESINMRSSPGSFAISLGGTLYCAIVDGVPEIYHWPIKFLGAGLALKHDGKSIFEFGHFRLQERFNSTTIEDRLSLVTYHGINDTQFTTEIVKKRGFIRLNGKEIIEKIAVNFPFLTEEGKKIAGLADLSSIDEAIEKDGSHAPSPKWLYNLTNSNNRQGFYISDNNFAIQHTHRKQSVLYVGFDDLSRARDNNRMRDPWGYSFAEKRNWSNLGILAYRSEWFRSNKLIDHLQRLAKDGFFEEYQKVIFAGVSMGAYAACAFSSLAPNSTVVAFSPQSTLDPRIAGWDKRYRSGRNADWSGPYADAAVELRGVGKAWIIYDPSVAEDRRHAARLAGPNVELLRARHAAHFSAQFLRQIGVLSDVVEECANDTMTPGRFYELYRPARTYRRYLLGVIDNVAKRNDPALTKRLELTLKNMSRPGLVNDLRKAVGMMR